MRQSSDNLSLFDVRTPEPAMSLPDRATVLALRRAVLRWYGKEQRSFMWRAAHPDPYVVLISECMLQQTQTARVEVLLPRFLERFPGVKQLAEASTAEVLKAWKGLGYNSRALRLRECAREIVRSFGGVVPRDAEALLGLPGLGPYTAHAIAVFAFHADLPVIDVNIRRVLSRIAAPQSTTIDVLPERDITTLAVHLQPRGKASSWYQALMDIGSTFCKARVTRCTECPARSHCRSAHTIVDVPRLRKSEPSHRNTPDRIWKGRVIDLLREHDEGYSSHDLLRVLFDAPTRDDEQWLERSMHAMNKGGFVVRERSRWRLNDADGE